MKKVILGLLVAMSFIACADKNGYKIKGEFTVPGYSPETVIYLSDTDPNNPREFIALDTAQIKTPNYFEFEGLFTDENAEPVIRYVDIVDGDNRKLGIVVLEKGYITIKVDSTSVTATGTPLNDKNAALSASLKDIQLKMQPLIATYHATDDKQTKEELAGKLNAMSDEMSKLNLTFIKENAGNVLGQLYFGMYSSGLELPELEEILVLIPENVKTDNEVIKGVVNKVATLKKTAVGQQYINLKGLNPEGKEIALSDYVGKNKLVLIDFWASWCGPCRKVMPELVELYKKYNKKGFEIVGVSLDRDKESWVKGISELGLTWPQMSDLKFWDSELSKEYAVSTIPYTVLIGEDGKILATRIGDKELSEKLAEVLK